MAAQDEWNWKRSPDRPIAEALELEPPTKPTRKAVNGRCPWVIGNYQCPSRCPGCGRGQCRRPDRDEPLPDQQCEYCEQRNRREQFNACLASVVDQLHLMEREAKLRALLRSAEPN